MCELLIICVACYQILHVVACCIVCPPSANAFYIRITRVAITIYALMGCLVSLVPNSNLSDHGSLLPLVKKHMTMFRSPYHSTCI